MAVSGLIGAIYKASGTSVTFTSQACTNSGDNLTYYITDRTKAYFDPTATLTIEKSTDGGTTWNPVTSGFTVQYAGGYIVFTASQGTALIRVSGKYLPIVQIGGGYNWKADVEADLMETTDFSSGGWKTYTPGTISFSGSFEKYWLDGTTFAEIGNDNLILILYVDAGTNKYRYEGFAKFKKDGLETPIDGIVKTSVDFQGSGNLYYRAG